MSASRRSLTALLALALVLAAPGPSRAVNVLTQFEGLSNDDNVAQTGQLILPPDDNLAVGVAHVFQMVNSVGRISTKGGTTLSSFALRDFFAVDSGYDHVDPRVIYDALSGRWFATYLQFSDAVSKSSVILAVSTSGDPTGTFCRYRLGNPTEEAFVQDFPMLGTSDDKVVVAYNGFNFPSATGAFLGSGYYVINKADLVGCVGGLRVTRVAPDPNAFTIHPAQSLSSTSDLYMVMVTPPPEGQPATSVTVFRVSGVPGVSTVTTTTTAVPITGGLPPPTAQQGGASQQLETGDGRIESAVWYQGALWGAAAAACTPPGDAAVRSCLRLGEILTGTMSGRQDVTFGSIGQYYYHPALRPDASGNLHVVFSSSSVSTFMDVRVTGRLASDPLGTFQASTQLKTGLGAHTHAAGATGDYSGAALDPSAPERVWVMGQWVRSTGDWDWGTFVAELKFNFVPAITSLSPASAVAFGPTFTLTVNGANFVSDSVVRWNGSARTTTFVSPTQLTAEIPAPDIAAAGTATVTVLNPAPGGGTSAGVSFPVTNPVPAISSISPATVAAGGGGFTLSVSGSNFVPASQVLWNGAARTTIFQGTTLLTTSVAAADIAAGALVNISVQTPGPGGGTSGTRTLTIENPVPALTSLAPSAAVAGGPGFTLTANGSGFVPSSVVRWNGAARTTTFVSPSQLTAQIAASDIASPGMATVTVFNPAPAGGVSGGQSFTIAVPTATLSVTLRGSAQGSVTSSPAGIGCPAACAANFAIGQVVTLTATPGAGASFKQWGGACAGASPTCDVTMSTAQSVTATFSQVFTDSTLTPGSSVVKAVHVLELRSAIDALRIQYGLGAYAWTNALTAGSSLVRALDVGELRTALAAAYVVAGQPVPSYTDPTLTPAATVIRASHFTEVRAAVRAIE